ncbi:MAG: polysaccharide pyruvyl transferase family protein [Clostridia bacterium]|nr:polysaccharide pyruvyl transferase family protein [Clostridia bacterium]
MKTAGIVTIHKINNYGAVLQAYALNKFLRNNGIEAYTIDFRTPRVEESYQIYYPFKSVMDIPRNLMCARYKKQLTLRNKRFNEFLEKKVPMTEKAYFSDEEMEKANFDFDYYLCGSDQIWNTHCTNYRDSFLLSFVKDKSKCISYAASIGESTIVEPLIPKFKKELSDFKSLSVRELQGSQLISGITNREVKTVTDPVFLLSKDDWETLLVENPIKGPYILFYAVHSGDVEGMRDFAKAMQKKLSMPLVILNKNLKDMLYKNKKFYCAGPQEFVSLIKNAEYVCTNSFHAVAFSSILHTKFWVFSSKAGVSTSSRIHSITEQLGLANRVLNRSNSANVELTEDIDFNEVDKKLRAMVKDSKEFLLNSLN